MNPSIHSISSEVNQQDLTSWRVPFPSVKPLTHSPSWCVSRTFKRSRSSQFFTLHSPSSSMENQKDDDTVNMSTSSQPPSSCTATHAHHARVSRLRRRWISRHVVPPRESPANSLASLLSKLLQWTCTSPFPSIFANALAIALPTECSQLISMVTSQQHPLASAQAAQAIETFLRLLLDIIDTSFDSSELLDQLFQLSLSPHHFIGPVARRLFWKTAQPLLRACLHVLMDEGIKTSQQVQGETRTATVVGMDTDETTTRFLQNIQTVWFSPEITHHLLATGEALRLAHFPNKSKPSPYQPHTRLWTWDDVTACVLEYIQSEHTENIHEDLAVSSTLQEPEHTFGILLSIDNASEEHSPDFLTASTLSLPRRMSTDVQSLCATAQQRMIQHILLTPDSPVCILLKGLVQLCCLCPGPASASLLASTWFDFSMEGARCLSKDVWKSAWETLGNPFLSKLPRVSIDWTETNSRLWVDFTLNIVTDDGGDGDDDVVDWIFFLNHFISPRALGYASHIMSHLLLWRRVDGLLTKRRPQRSLHRHLTAATTGNEKGIVTLSPTTAAQWRFIALIRPLISSIMLFAHHTALQAGHSLLTLCQQQQQQHSLEHHRVLSARDIRLQIQSTLKQAARTLSLDNNSNLMALAQYLAVDGQDEEPIRRILESLSKDCLQQQERMTTSGFLSWILIQLEQTLQLL